MTQDSLQEENEDMVIVNPTPDHTYSLDGILKENLDRVSYEVRRLDYDLAFAVAGKERFGKSTLLSQVLLCLDNTFTLDDVAFNINQFMEVYENSRKFKAIMFDETTAFIGARGALSRFNKLLLKTFSEMGSKNLFVGLAIPAFFELDRTIALHRIHFLLHVHKRGQFRFYNDVGCKNLYISGKKFFSYSFPPYNFHGRFTKFFPFDKEEYERRKQEGIREFNQTRNLELRAFRQRDALVKYVNDNNLLSVKKISEVLNITERRVFKIIENANKPIKNDI